MRHTRKKSTVFKNVIKNVARGTAAGVKHALASGVNCAVAQGASDAVDALTGGRPPKGQDTPAKRRDEKANPNAATGRSRTSATAKKKPAASRTRKHSRTA